LSGGAEGAIDLEEILAEDDFRVLGQVEILTILLLEVALQLGDSLRELLTGLIEVRETSLVGRGDALLQLLRITGNDGLHGLGKRLADAILIDGLVGAAGGSGQTCRAGETAG